MKKLMPLILLSVVLSLVCGCATSGDKYETRLRPPDAFNPVFYRYKQLQGEKIMVVAIDPGGNWAFGYDHGQATPQEAAEQATIKCDNARKEHMVHAKPKLFAINDKVVYYDKQLQ